MTVCFRKLIAYVTDTSIKLEVCHNDDDRSNNRIYVYNTVTSVDTEALLFTQKL